MTTTTQPSDPILIVSIVIPVYNEIDTIKSILESVQEQDIRNVQLETIVVDDGSDDGTRDILENIPHLYDHLILNPVNLGKGGAVREGLRASSGEFVLFQDADLEYDPIEYEKLFAPVLNFDADVVMGSRFLAPQWTKVFYYYHKLGNNLICTLFNLFFNTTWTDIYSCYLLYRKRLIDPDQLQTNGWNQQAEILGKLCKKELQLYEVPISYNGRSYKEGKKIRWYHTIKVIYTIIIVRLLPFGER